MVKPQLTIKIAIFDKYIQIIQNRSINGKNLAFIHFPLNNVQPQAQPYNRHLRLLWPAGTHDQQHHRRQKGLQHWFSYILELG